MEVGDRVGVYDGVEEGVVVVGCRVTGCSDGTLLGMIVGALVGVADGDTEGRDVEGRAVGVSGI